MQIIDLFSTPIASVYHPDYSKIKESLIQHCLNLKSTTPSGGSNWRSKSLYNTFNTYNILKDNTFEDLNNWVYDQATDFKNKLGQDKKLIPSGGWFNIYTKKDSQEFHNHNFDYISAIYYLKSKPSDARTYFNSPLPDNPNDPSFKADNKYTWVNYFSRPEEGKLILFRSSMEHCVETHTADDLRITVAYNYGI